MSGSHVGKGTGEVERWHWQSGERCEGGGPVVSGGREMTGAFEGKRWWSGADAQEREGV